MEDRPANAQQHHYLSDAKALDVDSVLVEWSVDTETMAVELDSYREVFRVGIPEFDHPIKQILFSPSAEPGDEDYGMLYIDHGDGSRESTTTLGGQGNDALGKILRINPLVDGAATYAVPDTNPFVGNPAMLDEVWSLGHRNPHHLAFTRNGALLVAEAGRDNVEEINLIMAGADYGWSQREGAYRRLVKSGVATGIATLPDNDARNNFVYPVAQFGHTGSIGESFGSQAIGGGFAVENGSELDGLYFYIDFPSSGEIFYSRISDLLAANTQGAPESLTVARTWRNGTVFDHDNNSDTAPLDMSMKAIVQSANGFVNTNNRVDVRIGQGPTGELYLFSKRNNMVYRVANSVNTTGEELSDEPLADFEFSSSGSNNNARWQVFDFEVKAGDLVEARVNWGDPAANVRIFLRNENSVQVDRDTEGRGSGMVSALAETDGKWSLGVAVNNDNTIRYDVRINTITAPPPPVSIPNYQFDGSGSMNSGRWQVFSFPVNAGKLVEAQVSWVDPTADVRVFLRNENRTQVDRDTDGSRLGVVSAVAKVNSEWSVAVLVNDLDTVNYDVSVNTDAEPTTDFEFSSSGSQDKGKWQVFDFDVEAGGLVDIQVDWDKPTADVRVFLRNENLMQVDRDTDGSGTAVVSALAEIDGKWSVAVLVNDDDVVTYRIRGSATTQ